MSSPIVPLALLALTTACIAVPARAVAAPAACPAGQTTVFACTTSNGKQVQVCDAGATLGYTFGRPGLRPELTFHVARERASTWQWQGIGRYMNYSVSLPNGKARYTVFSSVDRLADEPEPSLGISVEVQGRHVAQLTCEQEGSIENLFDIDLPADTPA